MPRNVAQSIKLYEKDAVGSTLIAVIDPARLGALEHGTRLPGGFGVARLSVSSTEGEFWEWRQNRLLSRLVIEETGRTVWEGRVENIALGGFWQVEIGAVGYWSNLEDATVNASYTGGADTGGSIVIDLLGRMHADTRQLSSSTARIETGPTIVQNYDEDWSVWRILTDTGRGVISFGDDDGARMDAAVWEGRELRYTRRSPTAVEWRAFVRPQNGGGVVRMSAPIDWADAANAVAVTYETDGEIFRTPPTVDAASVSRHIRRMRHVPNIGESTQATAIRRRDAELLSRRALRPRAQSLLIDRVWDANGIEWPLCRVRAGEIVRVPDFAPSAAVLDDAAPDALRAFFIEETRCDHAAGTLEIGTAG